MKYRHSLFFGVVLALTLLVVHAQSGFAQATGTIEIHKRVCDAGTTGNLFDECHDNPPEQTVSFSIDGGASQSVDADGNTIFASVAAGNHTVTETEGPPLEFVNLRVFCAVQDDSPEDFEVTTDGPNFSIDVADGEYIVCDVYNIPEDLSGQTPTPTTAAPTATAAPAATTVTLPNTGSGTDGGKSLLPVASFMAAALLLLGMTITLVSRRAHGPLGARTRR